MKTQLCRLITAIIIAKGGIITRGELHKIVNASRPSWPYTSGEMSDSIRHLIDLGQVEFTYKKGAYFDNSKNVISMKGKEWKMTQDEFWTKMAHENRRFGTCITEHSI